MTFKPINMIRYALERRVSERLGAVGCVAEGLENNHYSPESEWVSDYRWRKEHTGHRKLQ